MFKTTKNKTFNFSLRYYNERKERLENLKKGNRSQIKFTSNTRIINKMRGIRLFSILCILVFIVYLTLKN